MKRVNISTNIVIKKNYLIEIERLFCSFFNHVRNFRILAIKRCDPVIVTCERLYWAGVIATILNLLEDNYYHER